MSKNITGEVQTIGLGPAGIGTLVAASREGQLPHLAPGMVLIGDGDPEEFGGGNLNRLDSISNSPGGDFTDEPSKAPHFQSLLITTEARRLLTCWDKTVPLAAVAALERLIAQRALQVIEDAGGRVIPNTHVGALEHHKRKSGGYWQSLDAEGNPIACSRAVILATGAREVRGDYGDNNSKVILSGEILRSDGIENVQARLGGEPSSVVALGGSHSTFAALYKILHPREINYRPLISSEKITVVHRSEITTFYDPYLDHPLYCPEYTAPEDICDKTQRHYRFDELRGPSRDLYLWEKAISYLCVNNHAAVQKVLDKATLIIQGYGYQTNLIPISQMENGKSTEISLQISRGQAEVSQNCQVVNRSGAVIPGLFASGLGWGVHSDLEIGGGVNFRGHIDGVNAYQGPIGRRLIRTLSAYLQK